MQIAACNAALPEQPAAGEPTLSPLTDILLGDSSTGKKFNEAHVKQSD